MPRRNSSIRVRRPDPSDRSNGCVRKPAKWYGSISCWKFDMEVLSFGIDCAPGTNPQITRPAFDRSPAKTPASHECEQRATRHPKLFAFAWNSQLKAGEGDSGGLERSPGGRIRQGRSVANKLHCTSRQPCAAVDCLACWGVPGPVRFSRRMRPRAHAGASVIGGGWRERRFRKGWLRITIRRASMNDVSRRPGRVPSRRLPPADSPTSP